MHKRILLALALLGGMASAQVVEMSQDVQRHGGPGEEANKPKPTAEQLQRGRQMLENAEAAAGAMEGPMRAYALLQIGRAYAPDDKKKALSLLEEALTLTRDIEDDKMQTRERLQEQVLQAMVPLAPKKADELIENIDPRARGKALTSLLTYYQKNNEWDRAIQIVYRIAAEQEVPYDVVGRIMEKLPAERAADAQQLFSTALASYRNHANDQQRGRVSIGGDFSSLVQKNWKSVPREMALDAVHEILERAQKQVESSGSGGGHPLAVSMSTANGGVAFNSIYDFQLFQLLPVLKQLDPSEAEKRVKESQTVSSLTQKYPDGMGSLQPQQSGDKNGPPRSNMSMSVSGPPAGGGGGGGGRPPGGGLPSPMEMQQMQKVMADAEKHPQDALANAAALSQPTMRAQAYVGVAQANAKKNPSITRQALEKFSDEIKDVDTPQQVTLVSNAARLYLDIDETASAKKMIEKGMTIAEKAYKQDTNADDPNKALKAYWPSAEAYRGMLRLAGRVSPAWSMELLKEISDPEMKGLAQIALAQSWLDLPNGQTMVISSTKNGTMMQMSREQ